MTPLKRTPLKRSTKPLKRSPLRGRSKKTQTLYREERIPFVIKFLAENPICEVRWENCTVSSVDVHEKIRRSQQGAIVPGDKADEQGQVFFAVCRSCHDLLTSPTGEMRIEFTKRGFIMLRRIGDEGWVR